MTMLVSDLEARGYAIVRGAADPALIERLAADLAPAIETTPFSRGPFYGERTKRFGRLLARSRAAHPLVMNTPILAAARELIGRMHPHVGLNLTQLIAVHPEARAQIPHRDDTMWPLRDPVGEHLVNVIWPLTPFTRENGATRVWPGSHRGSPEPVAIEPEVAEMMPGDALVTLGSTLHGQGRNVSTTIRVGAVVGYHAAWLLPSENPWLSYPPDLVRDWDPELRRLIGYRRIEPNLNGVDCHDPWGEGRGAEDKLWPQQLEALERFRATTA